MANQYDTFVGSLQELPEYGEIELTVRDLNPGREKYAGRYVKALVAKDRSRLPDGDLLEVRFLRGRRHNKVFAIKILEELGDYKVTATRVRT